MDQARVAAERTEHEAIAFVLKLGRALHESGTPAHRLEDALTAVSSRLGLIGHFFSTPTSLLVAFGEQADQRTSLIRTEPKDVDLERLVLLDEIAGSVASGTMSVQDGQRALDDVKARPDRYSPALAALCFGTASGCAARFFGGGWGEIGVSAVEGLLVGLIVLWAARHRTLSRLLEAVAGFLVAAIAVAAEHRFGVSNSVAMVSGLIVLVPGLTLTVAMNELATRNLVSGTARLMGALMIFFSIGVGLALGLRVGELIKGVTVTGPPPPQPFWTLLLALAITPFAFTVLFKARPRDVLVIALTGWAGFASARAGANAFGPELGAFLGALAVGVSGNLYGRICNRPSAVPIMPSLLLLVPGSIGFSSISVLMGGDVVSGLDLAFKMTMVAASLVTGLLLSNVAIPPRRAL